MPDDAEVLKKYDDLKKRFDELNSILSIDDLKACCESAESKLKNILDESRTYNDLFFNKRLERHMAHANFGGFTPFSIISNFLSFNKKFDREKVFKILGQINDDIESALKSGKAELVEKVVSLVEKEKDFLIKNKVKIFSDKDYLFSIERIIFHELLHHYFASKSLMGGSPSLNEGINESYSFAFNGLMHLYDDDYVFNLKTLKKDVLNLYKLIPDRKKHYLSDDNKQYIFMKPFILLIGVLVICDAFMRKKNDFKNKDLFLKSYSCSFVSDIYVLAKEALDNLIVVSDDELAIKNFVFDTLFTISLSQLRHTQ